MHNQVAPGLGKIGVLVALEVDRQEADELAALGRQIAMHVAAANPVALDLAGVPAETLEREKAILADKNQGKPPQVLEKIVASGLKSYAKDNCLLEQAYIHDPSKSVDAGREGRRRQGRRPRSRSPASCATRWARASRRRTTTSPPRSPPRPARRTEADAIGARPREGRALGESPSCAS